MPARVAPSLLAADFANLEKEIRRAEATGISTLHVDVMDGHFVNNISIGPVVVQAIRKVTKLQLDVHLMISEPEKYIDSFAEAGSDGITIHLETCPEPEALLQKIGRLGKVRGLSINPDMPVSALNGHLEYIDRLLLMSVYPGFGGQKFIPETIERIKEAKELIRKTGRAIELEVDGGINLENSSEVRKAGADLIVAGTAAFGAPDMNEAVQKLCMD